MATVNKGALSGRIREVVDMFERRMVDIGCLQEVRYAGTMVPEYMEVRKSTSFGGADQKRAKME